MEDQEKVSVEEQVAPVETDEVHEIEHKEEVQEDAQERNWKALREQNKYLESQVKNQQELLENVLKMQQHAAPVAQTQPEPDEFDEIDDDEYLDKAKVSKLIAREAKKIAAQEVQTFYQKQDQAQWQTKLKGKYSDFDDVVNAQTIALLEQNDPELAESIAALQDPYKIGLQSYKYIKALGLGKKEEQKSRRARETEKVIEKNEKFIQSPISYQKRPMAQAFSLSDEEKKAAYEEMMFYANQGG